jgi:hypothetical protein
MASSRLWYLAVKFETTKAVAVKPTTFLPFKEGWIDFKPEIIKNNPIKGIRANNLQAKTWKVATAGKYTFDADCYFMGYWLKAALGSYSVTNLTNAYKHTFNVANDVPSLTVEQLKWDPTGTLNYEVSRAFWVLVDSFELSASDNIASFNVELKAHWQFLKGQVVNNVTVGASSTVTLKTSESEGLVATDIIKIVDRTASTQESTTVTSYAAPNITANVAAAYSATNNVKVELRPQTPTYDANESILVFSNFNFQFGADLTAAASAAEENIENWTLSFSNNLEERYGSKRNSPSVIAPKGWDGSLKFTQYFEDLDSRDSYLNQTRKACIITWDVEKKIGTTSYFFKIEIRLNDLRFTSRSLDVKTDELLVTELETAIFHNTTDGKGIEINMWNDLTTY